jgi:hypothetical protein
MRTWLQQLPDRWMPAGSETMDAETRLRFRFGTQAWLIAWPLAVAWTVLSASSGLWVAALLNGWLVVTGPLVLWGLRRTAKLSPWFELSLCSALLLFGPGMLGQTPADETNLFVSVIIPLVAGFLFGRRAAVGWTVLTIVVATTSLLLAHAGFTLPVSDPMPC